MRADKRNGFYTEILPVDPDKADQDLWDVLSHGIDGRRAFRHRQDQQEVALWLSRAYLNIVETMELETGDTADYRTTP